MHQLFRPLPCLFVLAVLAGTSDDSLAARPKQVQQEKKSTVATARPKQVQQEKKSAATTARSERGAAIKKQDKSAKKKDDKTAKTGAKPKHVAKRQDCGEKAGTGTDGRSGRGQGRDGSRAARQDQ
jgi:type IV secretory pathway VirB10-like protein